MQCVHCVALNLGVGVIQVPVARKQTSVCEGGNANGDLNGGNAMPG